MSRKITYKSASSNLEKMAKPTSSGRSGVGMEEHIKEYFYIDIEKLKAFRHQARKNFNSEEIDALANSIKHYGIRQPLTITKIDKEGRYEVISGERRLRAAIQSGLKKVPCIIVNKNEKLSEIALIENIHRKDLHPFELGEAYEKLIETKYFKNQTEIAENLSVSKSHVSDHIKYTIIPQEIKDYVIANNLRSRDTFRKLLKNYDDILALKSLLGLEKSTIEKQFSVCRISYNSGKLILQDKGIRKLSLKQKKLLKTKLLALAETL